MGLNKNFVHKNYSGNQIIQFVVETVPVLPDEGTSIIQRANGSLLFVKNNTEQELYARINDEWFPWGGVSDYKVATSINDKFPDFLTVKLSGKGVVITEDPTGDKFQTLITNNYTKVDSMGDVNPVGIGENGVFVWDNEIKKYVKATVGKGLILNVRKNVTLGEEVSTTYELETFTAVRNHVIEHTFNMLGIIPEKSYTAMYIHSDANIDKRFFNLTGGCDKGSCKVTIYAHRIDDTTTTTMITQDFVVQYDAINYEEYDKVGPGPYWPLDDDRIEIVISESVNCEHLILTMGILTMSLH